MGDRMGAGKPSRYVTSHLGQLSLPLLESQLISLNQVPLVGPAGVSAPQHGDYNTGKSSTGLYGWD